MKTFLTTFALLFSLVCVPNLNAKEAKRGTIVKTTIHKSNGEKQVISRVILTNKK
jgi:hypothetical protein